MDWILLVVLLVIFGGGFWVMGRLDRFVAQCVRQTRRETKAQRPRQLELEQLGEDALLDAVRSYCEQHEDARLTLWDGAPWEGVG